MMNKKYYVIKPISSLSIITGSISLIIFSWGIFTHIQDTIPIYGLIIIFIIGIYGLITPFFPEYILTDEYIVINFLNIMKHKHRYTDIKNINNPVPFSIYINPGFPNIPHHCGTLKNQEEMIKIILEKNPECRISKSLAKKMKKRLGKSFDEFID